MATKNEYIYGLGRRKAATARVRLYKGKGEITINDRPAAEYLSGNKSLLAEITDPLALAGKQNDYSVSIRVSGGFGRPSRRHQACPQQSLDDRNG